MLQIGSFKIICTDSTEILFSKLRLAGFNYHLSKRNIFTSPYCAGVSIKHCLLTFYHSRCVRSVHFYFESSLLYLACTDPDGGGQVVRTPPPPEKSQKYRIS